MPGDFNEDFNADFGPTALIPDGSDFNADFNDDFGPLTLVPPPLPPPVYGPPTASEIEDALAGRRGSVHLSYLFEQRGRDFSFQADLTRAVVSGEISLDNNRAVIRTATFMLLPERLPPGFDMASDNIAVRAKLLVPVYRPGYGTVPPGIRIAETIIPMGLFHLDAPKKRYEDNGRSMQNVEASDLTSLLLTAKTPVPYTVASGAGYIAEVRKVLDIVGVQHSLPDTADVTPVAMAWAPGTSYGQITSDLLLGINHYPLWANGTGVFVTRERVRPETEGGNQIYSTASEPRLLISPFEKSEDRSRWANRVVVVIDDPRRTAGYALRVNNDPASAVSVASLTPAGQEPVVNPDPPISGGRVVDLLTADEIADFELKDRSARSLPGTINTFPDPRRGPREFYKLTIEDVETDTLWRAESWRYSLTPGESAGDMSHDVSQIVPFTTSPVISLGGTILTANAANIVSGGRTITLTLPAQQAWAWASAGAAFDAQRAGILAGLVSLGNQLHGWNAEVVPALSVTNVVRTSNTVVTITLPAVAAYAITQIETVHATVPSTAISGGLINFVAPGFTIVP